MKLSRKTRYEYLAEVLSTVIAIVLIQYMPDEMMFIGTTKSKWFLVLLAASPALITFGISQSGKESLFTTIYLVIADLGVILLVLYNKGIYTPNFEVIGLGVLAILFIFESMHLRKDHPMGTTLCLNFKWVDDEKTWKALQKKGSLLIFLEGILIALGDVLLALEVIGLGIIIPTIVITFYIITFYLMKTSK